MYQPYDKCKSYTNNYFASDGEAPCMLNFIGRQAVLDMCLCACVYGHLTILYLFVNLVPYVVQILNYVVCMILINYFDIINMVGNLWQLCFVFMWHKQLVILLVRLINLGSDNIEQLIELCIFQTLCFLRLDASGVVDFCIRWCLGMFLSLYACFDHLFWV